MPSYSLLDLNRWAKSEGGKCTSKDYYGLKVLHSWLCSKGHAFDLMPFYVRQGAWCPKCSQTERIEEALALMREFAEKRGGRCLSENYVDNQTPLKWECKNKHKFKASRAIIKGRKNFCAECAFQYMLEKNLKKVKEIAEKKGGKCLSRKYVSAYTKMKFQCEKGHVWETSFQSIVYDNSWCIHCMPNRRLTIKEIRKWAKERGWVCLSKEVKGQHDRLLWKCERGHKVEMTPQVFKRGGGCTKCSKLSSQEESLKLMQKWAEERGGKCLSTKYVNTEEPLKWECKNGHRFSLTRDYIKQKDKKNWCSQCSQIEERRDKLAKVSDYAKKREGKCLSTEYINLYTPLTFRCKKGHIWQTPPINIFYRASWCQKCCHNAKLDMKEMHEMAAARNGKCLSKKYVNTNTKLKWQCEKGHIWETMPSNIRSGCWCPKCANINKRKKENK